MRWVGVGLSAVWVARPCVEYARVNYLYTLTDGYHGRAQRFIFTYRRSSSGRISDGQDVQGQQPSKVEISGCRFT